PADGPTTWPVACARWLDRLRSMTRSKSIKYSPAVERLITDRLPALGPGSPNEAVRAQLAALSVEAAFAGHKVVDRSAAHCCLSGLWLLHDFLGESHK